MSEVTRDKLFSGTQRRKLKRIQNQSNEIQHYKTQIILESCQVIVESLFSDGAQNNTGKFAVKGDIFSMGQLR